MYFETVVISLKEVTKMSKFSRLFTGWILFAFAVVNMANAAFMHMMKVDGSVGIGAIARWLLIGLAFAGWHLLAFRK